MSSEQDAALLVPSAMARIPTNGLVDGKPVRASATEKGWTIREWAHWEEVKVQCHLAGPLILVNLLQTAIQLISIMFVGHLGELALSSSSVAVSITNVAGMCVMMGMASSLETLCGQAYGAKQYHMLGLYLQVGLVVLNATALPIAVIYAYMGKILLALGQDEAISEKAGEYVIWLIPMLFAYACSQPLIRFLQTQSLVSAMVACAITTIACHLPMCWFFIYKVGLGSKGAALATSISGWIFVSLLSLYVRFSSSCQKTRAPLSREAFKHVRGFLKLAIPSAAMICLEWWCYEILVLLSGLLPDPELQTSTLAICLNTAQITYMIPFGLSAAVSTRVSNELGSGHSQTAKQAVRVAIGLTVVQACIVSMVLLASRNVVGHAFSSDEDVIRSVATILPLLALSSIFDSTQAVLSGVARGCGWQRVGAIFNLGSFYIVALPVGSILGFTTSLKARGLWVGVICGPFVQIIAFGSLIWAANWDKEVSDTRARIGSNHLLLQEPLLQ